MLLRMSARMIQVRNVPDDVHRTLKARAAKAGMSLSDYLLRELTLLARRPTFEEIFEQIDRDGPALEGIDAAELVREGREERDRELVSGILRDLPDP
jgi:hypothetical protein